MTKWFTSDWHFSHINIIGYTGRPFESVPEMNAAMVQIWNSTVAPNDEVVFLGDFAMGKISESLPVALRLNGIKYLIPGNHDRCHSSTKKSEEWVKKYEEVGFRILTQQTLAAIGDEIVTVCHFPYSDSEKDEREHLTKYHPIRSRNILVHGHVHDRYKVKDGMINVGIDAWGGKLVSEEEIVGKIKLIKLDPSYYEGKEQWT